jgi:hypothetical protein
MGKPAWLPFEAFEENHEDTEYDIQLKAKQMGKQGTV